LTVPATADRAQPAGGGCDRNAHWRPEGQYHYDHWGWRTEFDQNGHLRIDAGTNPASVSTRSGSATSFKVGPRAIKVDKLGRMYISGNTLDHSMAIANSTGGVIARATVSNGGKMFEPPGGVAPMVTFTRRCPILIVDTRTDREPMQP